VYRFAILLLLAMLALATCAGAVTWDTIVGPADEGSGDYNHIGTDGVSLYAVFQNNEFWKYSFSQDTPTAGT
jgi:hypothetical protein